METDNVGIIGHHLCFKNDFNITLEGGFTSQRATYLEADINYCE